MSKLIPFVCLLFIAAAALGWTRAGISAGLQPAEIDKWNVLPTEALTKSDYKQLVTKLKQSALLPLSRKEQRELDAAGIASVANNTLVARPPFPKILGSSRLNRTRYIHVLGPDKSAIKLRQGDVLDSGWEIKTVDRRQVVAVFDNEELVVPIIPYLGDAFDKPAAPDEGSIQSGTNVNGAVKSPDGE